MLPLGSLGSLLAPFGLLLGAIFWLHLWFEYMTRPNNTTSHFFKSLAWRNARKRLNDKKNDRKNYNLNNQTKTKMFNKEIYLTKVLSKEHCKSPSLPNLSMGKKNSSKTIKKVPQTAQKSRNKHNMAVFTMDPIAYRRAKRD